MCNCKRKANNGVTAKPAAAVSDDTALATYATRSAEQSRGEVQQPSSVIARKAGETRIAYLKRVSQLKEPKVASTVSAIATAERSAIKAANELRLDQCYLCAKKHIGRAQIFFEEYHTGYDDRVKRLIDSLQLSEDAVKQAFLLKERVQAHLDMASGELLGKPTEGYTTNKSHVDVANMIREERLKLQDDPTYSPRFSDMLEQVHLLQYSE